jgi:hypothetical protein
MRGRGFGFEVTNFNVWDCCRKGDMTAGLRPTSKLSDDELLREWSIFNLQVTFQNLLQIEN